MVLFDIFHLKIQIPEGTFDWRPQLARYLDNLSLLSSTENVNNIQIIFSEFIPVLIKLFWSCFQFQYNKTDWLFYPRILKNLKTPKNHWNFSPLIRDSSMNFTKILYAVRYCPIQLKSTRLLAQKPYVFDRFKFSRYLAFLLMISNIWMRSLPSVFQASSNGIISVRTV